jgi:hypothetical protein
MQMSCSLELDTYIIIKDGLFEADVIPFHLRNASTAIVLVGLDTA